MLLERWCQLLVSVCTDYPIRSTTLLLIRSNSPMYERLFTIDKAKVHGEDGGG